jgi:hypothetical protein
VTDQLPDVEALRAHVDDLFPALQADLVSLVRIPSVSAAAFDQAHVAASADAVAALLRDAGLPDVRILSSARPDGSPGAPAVVARRPAPDGAPTVLLYAHHDVQPPGDRATWETDPFEPVQVGERLYGRGAADDKAGVVAHVGALRALAALGEDPDVGVTVFVEGEEESGSPSFRGGSSRTTASCSRPTSSSSPTRRTGASACPRSPRRCAGSWTARSRWRCSSTRCTRACSVGLCSTPTCCSRG